jgi:hypothetical protein
MDEAYEPGCAAIVVDVQNDAADPAAPSAGRV